MRGYLCTDGCHKRALRTQTLLLLGTIHCLGVAGKVRGADGDLLVTRGVAVNCQEERRAEMFKVPESSKYESLELAKSLTTWAPFIQEAWKGWGPSTLFHCGMSATGTGSLSQNPGLRGKMSITVHCSATSPPFLISYILARDRE